MQSPCAACATFTTAGSIRRGQDVNEIEMSRIKELAQEAWGDSHAGAPLPGPHSRALTAYVTVGKPRSVKDFNIDASLAGSEDVDEEDFDTVFGTSSPSPRDVAKLVDDKKNQGISGMRIIALSLSLELGRVPALGEVAGNVFYGSDPRIADIVKKQKKAGIQTMQKILEGTDVRLRLNSHFVCIIREFSERRQIVEASLVTQFWAETQSVSQDDAVLVQYMLEYFRKNPGRGIPTVVDVLVAQRVIGSRAASSGASPEAIKEVKETNKSLKQELGETKRILNELKAEMGRIKSKIGNTSQQAPGGGGKGVR